jgi:hypothetical protein
MITGPFATMLSDGWKMGGLNARLIQGVLNVGFTLLVVGSMIIILSQAITRWMAARRPSPRDTNLPSESAAGR